MRRHVLRWKHVVLTILLLIVCVAAVQPALASNGQDRVSFGQRIIVGQDETVGDLVCFLCSIENHGTVHGDVVSFLGGVKSEGSIRGDVVSFLGDVSVAGEASITGDLVIFGGTLRKSAQAQISSEQVIFPFGLLILPILIFVAIVWGLTRLFHTRRYMSAGPFIR